MEFTLAAGNSKGLLGQPQQMNFLSNCRINTACGVNIKGITVKGKGRRLLCQKDVCLPVADTACWSVLQVKR